MQSEGDTVFVTAGSMSVASASSSGAGPLSRYLTLLHAAEIASRQEGT